MSQLNLLDTLSTEKDKRPPVLSGTSRAGNHAGRLTRNLLLFSIILLSGCLRSENGLNDHAAKNESAERAPAGEGSTSQGPQNVDESLGFTRRNFQEAPMLKRLVQAGKLPPVGERLPENPLIITPVERQGIYGGAIRRALIADIIDQYAITKTLNENLVGYERFPPNRVQLNLAENYTFETTVIP
jgi:hypothetical protein